ncbi:tRNA (adenosine(37)-N6)-threonylcarbamoyltransferase complex transferase subunit TsaD [Thalassoroseus pseudoceratinae]|uniref:tRNA (adenosine(37)-N6)-threonylcarbamoyltransferase complex transferase subunit TsaD n=1 Tax=Thalassoroseus pseudoceratinae TaxID=2713176 RepID=UPI0014227F78|nr:tRNA (adenosine(37)-N6)-threonylcarbamoyltransferase complex transferase subunit TsaD [Thalassoroseus pseudoceratinae]
MEYLLALETSCDETAAAVIARDRRVLSSIVASQAELHERYGGVVPEIASRAHVQRILPVIDEAVKSAGIALTDLAAIAVTTEPGLVGSLLVGLTAAKTLSSVLRVPLVAVNHIEAHLYACRMAANREVFPAVGLVVSGGHTNLYDCRSALEFQLLGSTIDDAAGEAFDKVAIQLGLSYPGGPSIEAASRDGDETAFDFPRTFIANDRLEFSFSGIKTAVRYQVTGVPGSRQPPPPPMTPQRVADMAASFQAAVVDVLVAKCKLALQKTGHRKLCIGGGVAANRALREKSTRMAEDLGSEVFFAPLNLCTDNAAMGAIAWELFEAGRFAPLDVDVTPGLVRLQR